MIIIIIIIIITSLILIIRNRMAATRVLMKKTWSSGFQIVAWKILRQ
jgi:hypothetical protein